MPVQQVNGECLRQTLNIQASVRITGLHLRFERPPDVFDLGVARLETIEDFNVARVVAGFFRYGFQQALRHAQ